MTKHAMVAMPDTLSDVLLTVLVDRLTGQPPAACDSGDFEAF